MKKQKKSDALLQEWKQIRRMSKDVIRNVSSADDRARAFAFDPVLAEITIADVEQAYTFAGKEF